MHPGQCLDREHDRRPDSVARHPSARAQAVAIPLTETMMSDERSRGEIHEISPGDLRWQAIVELAAGEVDVGSSDWSRQAGSMPRAVAHHRVRRPWPFSTPTSRSEQWPRRRTGDGVRNTRKIAATATE